MKLENRYQGEKYQVKLEWRSKNSGSVTFPEQRWQYLKS